MPTASTAASSLASTSRTARASGQEDATATVSSFYCPIRTCCSCWRKRVIWRWSGPPPIGSRNSPESRRSRARPGTTRCWSATSCWFATGRRWPHSGCPLRAARKYRLPGHSGPQQRRPLHRGAQSSDLGLQLPYTPQVPVGASSRPAQHCCTLVKEITYGKYNPSWVEQEHLPRRRSELRASLRPEFFEPRFQDRGQRKRLPEFA